MLSSSIRALRNMEFSFIAIISRLTLTRSGSIYQGPIYCYIIKEWFFYINHFSLIIFYHSVEALDYSGLLIHVHSHLVQSYARAERIWQSLFVIINPQTGNGLRCRWRHAQKRWSREFEDFEKTVVGYSTVEGAVEFSTVEAYGWVYRIPTGRDELRS